MHDLQMQIKHVDATH